MNQQQHARLRGRFPALAQEVSSHPLVYLDNAATTQNRKPCWMRSITTIQPTMPACTAPPMPLSGRSRAPKMPADGCFINALAATK